jgi:hypothetical protein
VTLDDLCEDIEHIDVLKVDIQGAEHLLLAGGRRTIARVRTLLIEVSLVDPNPHRVLEELSPSLVHGGFSTQSMRAPTCCSSEIG